MLFGMAVFQEGYKWIAIYLFFLASSLGRPVNTCSSASKELHVCLNIYLERDFSLIEAFVNGQKAPTVHRRINLEGMFLDNTCSNIAKLYNCYWGVLPECDSLWKFDRFFRVMSVLNSTNNHLCKEQRRNLRDLLLSSGALILAHSQASNCTGFDWTMSWRHVLRMQKSPSDTCEDLEAYWSCLESFLMKVENGPQAAEVYKKLIDVWLRDWCGKNLTAVEEKKYFYRVVDKIEEGFIKAQEELERREELNEISRS